MDSEPGSQEALRAKLAAERDEVPWRELRAHALADRLFLVGVHLDLVEVAVAIALDATAEVGAWVEEGALRRPGPAQIAVFDADEEVVLRCVIVKPFVLAQQASASDGVV